MSPVIDLSELVAYTNWQRTHWRAWFEQHGSAALGLPTGPNGDRFPTIGTVIRHVFSAELRYAERITGTPLTDTSTVPVDEPAALFEFGGLVRARLVRLIDTLPAGRWTVPVEFSLLNSVVRSSPLKIVLHVLTHEIRHWAQIATMLRFQGCSGGLQDLLLSPVLGDPIEL